jgi:peptidoglycan hydrolase-like protein with peptidoglycan-binding domain
VVATSALVLAFEPAAALAANAGSSRAALPTAHVKQSTPHALNATTSAGALASGSGYDSPGGSARVRALQRRLARAGAAPGPIDGLYGPLTEQAVTHFQAAYGLQVDGIAGPLTWAALSAPTAVLHPGAGYESGGSAPVLALQRRLVRAGAAPGPIDGLYGPLTEQAVRHFQAAHGLQVNGIAGPQTIARLQSQARPHHRARPRPKNPNAPSHPARPRPTTPNAPSRQPVPGHAPGNVRHARPQTGSPSAVWWVLLGALGLGLALGAAWFVRERRRPQRVNGLIPSSATLTKAHEAAGPDQLTRVPEAQNNVTGEERPDRRADERGEAIGAFNRGALLEEQHDLAGAEAAYRRADERGDPTGAFNLGVLLEARRDVAGAEAAYRRADERGHAAAVTNLGVLLEARHDVAGAEAAYRRADQRGDPTSAFNLGVLLEEQNDLAGAEAAYRRAEERGDGHLADLARAARLDLRGAIRSSGTGREGGGHDDA